MNFSCDLPHFYKNSNSNIRDSVCVFQSQRQFVPSKIVILNRGVCVCVCVCVCVLVTQSRSIICNPMDCSLPGSSVHGILQARIWEWVAIHFSRGSF